MTRTAQEYPVKAMAYRVLWQTEVQQADLDADRKVETPSEFLIDLAERIATLCVQSEPEANGRAVSLPRDAGALDGYCRVPSGHCDGPVIVRPEVMLFSADGNVRPLDAIEADIIRIAVNRYGGRVSEVARRLNIGRSTLYRKLDGLGISYAKQRSE